MLSKPTRSWDDHFDGARNLPDDFLEKRDTPRIGSKGLEGRKPQRLLIEGYRVGTAHFGAKRANKGVSERAAPFFNSYHGREELSTIRTFTSSIRSIVAANSSAMRP